MHTHTNYTLNKQSMQHFVLISSVSLQYVDKDTATQLPTIKQENLQTIFIYPCLFSIGTWIGRGYLKTKEGLNIMCCVRTCICDIHTLGYQSWSWTKLTCEEIC